MPLIKMLYLTNDSEGKEVIDLLKKHNVGCRIFYCSQDEKRIYDCPRLLSSEGEWIGMNAIQNFIKELPYLQSLISSGYYNKTPEQREMARRLSVA